MNWDSIDLVVFDVDGTLYNQSRLRILMMREVLLDAASRLSFDTLRVIRHYRRIREQLAEREVAPFEAVLTTETASRTGHSVVEVQAIAKEWLERRPLPYLAACRYRGLDKLFAALRDHGKAIGILSDYPADAKLSALGLDADHIVCASDEGVGFLKPNPLGLRTIIASAAASPERTVLIGDRVDRDGAAARRLGAWSLIRSPRPLEGWETFASFEDPIFQSILVGK